MKDLSRFIYEKRSEQGYQNKMAGDKFEMKLLGQAKRNSVLAIRSSGSRTLIDIVKFKRNKIVLISAKKNGYFEKWELEGLRKLKTMLPDICEIKIAHYISPKKYRMSKLQ